jgi:uncharacterized protein (DUF362 family)
MAGVITGTALRIDSKAESSKFAIPGLYPGRVIAVESPESYVSGKYQAEPIRAMIQKGMCGLTGADAWQEAWKQFFEPGDVVGIKTNPVGNPICSSPQAMAAIFEGIFSTGVKPQDVVVYDRYRAQFASSGIARWLPQGVRTMFAAEDYVNFQDDIRGYDAEHYVELPLIFPGRDPNALASKRSYAAEFISKHVNKVLNFPILKDHDGAGVTLALKNMSHGLVNNVNRSHPTPDQMLFADFIPHVVSMPVIRNKVVLNILDGIRGIFHGGPLLQTPNYAWDHKTMYFATDPVAMDRIGWVVMDAQRKRAGMVPVNVATKDVWTEARVRRPEYIIAAGKLGLGVWEDEKINLKRLTV